jgi:ubiquinone/menaquinone biosynthesis C-methylase UbiE
MNEFDTFSVNYTEDMTKCVPYYLDLIEAFTTDYPQDFNPKNILDLGCGNGNVTAQLIQLFPEAKYTLVDASQDMLDLCELRFKDLSITFVQSYFRDFTFRSEQYDLVVAGFSLHHCDAEEKQFLFKQIENTLMPNGIFSSSDLMINKKNPDHSRLIKYWKTFVTNNYADDEKWKWLMEHYDEFDKPDNFKNQMAWLEKLGYKVIDTKVNDKYWAHFKVTRIPKVFKK